MKKIIIALAAVAGLTFSACDLDEYNPSAGDASLNSMSSWAGLQAYCYSCLSDQLYTASDWMFASEGGTDLWVAKTNGTGSKDLFYYEDMTPSTNALNKLFKQCYSMLTTCNSVINEAPNITLDLDPDVRDVLVAETKALRAFYYYILVTNFGPVTLTLESNASVSGAIERYPKRSSEKAIYDQIIKDLTEAIPVLGVQPYQNNKARFTKKGAKGLLARVYAQRAGLGDSKYGDGRQYWELARDTAEELIANAAANGAKLYDDIYDTWADANNRHNEEALLIAAGADPMSGDDSYTYASKSNKLSAYSCANAGACSEFWNKNHKPSDKGYFYGRHNSSAWMPSKYLMYCFDPTWDKRWEATWQYAYCEWSMVQCGWVGYDKGVITVTEAMCDKYGIDKSNIGKTIKPYADCDGIANTLAGNQYPAKIWKKGTTEQTATVENLMTVDEVGTRKAYAVPYPVAADDDRFNIVSVHTDAELQKYKEGKSIFFAFKLSDLYDSNDYPYGGVPQGSEAGNPPAIGDGKTNAHQAYPSLTKFNWSYEGVFVGSNLQLKNGDMFIMRMAEVYLIAAEAEQMLGQGGKAAEYLNVLRKRAARPGVAESVWKLSTATEDDIFDEYARELCGEFNRWALLKRHNAFEERLARYNKRAAKSFKPFHYNRPISNDFLQTILNAEEYGDNGYGATAASGLEGIE